MLKELENVPHSPDEPARRWFTSANLDLIVWLDEAGSPKAFQLCYDKTRSEHALTWTRERGFSHLAIDDGEQGGGLDHKGTPILVPDGHYDIQQLLALFETASEGVPAEIVEFVGRTMRSHPDRERAR